MINLTNPSSDLVEIKFLSDWFEDTLIDKYNLMLDNVYDSHVKDIVSLLNMTIKSINILGFSLDTVSQEQGNGLNHVTSFQLGSKSWVQGLTSNTIKIELHHADSYITWLFLWESIQRQISADHKSTMRDVLVVNILNTRRQKVFDFVFRDFSFIGIDDLTLDAETQNTDFGTFEIEIQFKRAGASVTGVGTQIKY